MVGDADAGRVEPAVNPSVREARRRRLIRMTKEQIAGRAGPLRQVRYRDLVVSPLALELECRKLLQRAQRAIATIVTSGVYAGDLRGTVEEPVLRQHEWEIAVALREITELLLELVSSYAGGTAGPMTTAIRFPRIARYRKPGTPPRPGFWRLNCWRRRWRRPRPRDGTGRRPTGWRPTTTSISTWSHALRRTSVPPWKSPAWPSRPPRRRKRSARLCSAPHWRRRH